MVFKAATLNWDSSRKGMEAGGHETSLYINRGDVEWTEQGKEFKEFLLNLSERSFVFVFVCMCVKLYLLFYTTLTYLSEILFVAGAVLQNL